MAEIEVRKVWRKNDRSVRRDAIEFWQRLDILPKGADIEARADQLTAAAYDGDRLVGLSSADIHLIPMVDRKFALWRVLVDPEYRGDHLARQNLSMMFWGDEYLRKWSLDHPEEELCGVGWVMENTDMFLHRLPLITKDGLTSPPGVIGPNILKEGTDAYEWLKDFPLTFHGYTSGGHALWLKWFPHIEIEIT